MLGDEVGSYAEVLTDALLKQDFLFEDSGILGIGRRGEEVFGGRNFMDLMAVFSEPPMFKVLAGRTELGQVPLRLFTMEAPDGHVILLGGRDWHVLDIDWRRGVVQVEPAEQRGKVRWFTEGRSLSFEICQGLKRVLAGEPFGRAKLSRRASDHLDRARDDFSWVPAGDELTMRREPDGTERLWTFAGGDVNVWLAIGLGDLADQVVPGDLSMRLVPDADPGEVMDAVRSIEPGDLALDDGVAEGAVERLKFAEALPEAVAHTVVFRHRVPRLDPVVRRGG